MDFRGNSSLPYLYSFGSLLLWIYCVPAAVGRNVDREKLDTAVFSKSFALFPPCLAWCPHIIAI